MISSTTTLGEVTRMFDLAKSVGKMVGKPKGNKEVYRVATTIKTPLEGDKVLEKELNYLASFKNGKPFKIVDESMWGGERGRVIYNAETNTINNTAHDQGYYRRKIIDLTDNKIKGQFDLYVGKKGYIDFAAIYTPDKGVTTGERINDLWRENGFGYGPYGNLQYSLREFNKEMQPKK